MQLSQNNVPPLITLITPISTNVVARFKRKKEEEERKKKERRKKKNYPHLAMWLFYRKVLVLRSERTSRGPINQVWGELPSPPIYTRVCGRLKETRLPSRDISYVVNPLLW